MLAQAFDQMQTRFAIDLFRSIQVLADRHLGLREERLVLGGATYSYATRGEGDRPLVLVHGFASDRSCWSLLLSKIKGSQRIIVLDLPAWGKSSFDSKASYTPLAQAQRLEEIRQALGIERWHLAGISMGGAISGVYAALYPDRVLSLSLLNAAGIGGSAQAPFVREALRGSNRLIMKVPEDIEALLSFVFLRRPFLPRFVKRALAFDYLRRRMIQERLFADLIADPQILERHFSMIKAPIQVIWGRYDKVIDVSCVETLRALKSEIAVHIFEDCGHFPIMEKPRETAALLINFIRKQTHSRDT